MAFIDDVKDALRLSGTAHDTEVNDLIEAAKADLGLAGVTILATTDYLIRQAVKSYCKANFGWDNPERAEYQRQYDLLKMNLMLTKEYGGVGVVV